jgi:PAS domain S-box-containing protein
MGQTHYLQAELHELVRTDVDIFEFLQAGSLDGVWYWDLENSEQEWMSPRFWEVFGYSADEKRHLASEWQDMIHPEDLQSALENFHAHCADPNVAYDQVVRYTGKDGATVWVRCRGLAIRDADGKPIRMLGAHNDVTELKAAEAPLRGQNQDLESFQTLAPNREDRMIELKQEVNGLLAELGRPARYDVNFGD